VSFWLDPQTYTSLLSLTLLEVVLGIDNIIFISILAGKLPQAQRQKARVIGLLAALLGRIGLIFSISFLTSLTQPLLHVGPLHISGKDLVLLIGGLFLIAKSTHEIYEKTEGHTATAASGAGVKALSFSAVVWQILLIDMVFSLDSIITAVGMASNISIMIVAILISLTVMTLASQSIGEFIDRHPSVKILALAFLLMIGMLLTAEAFHVKVPKAYIYFSLGFALLVEFLNIRSQSRPSAKLATTRHTLPKDT
jgi:predicted tellurium resistance membrane protein TerC